VAATSRVVREWGWWGTASLLHKKAAVSSALLGGSRIAVALCKLVLVLVACAVLAAMLPPCAVCPLHHMKPNQQLCIWHYMMRRAKY
jgi:hypothetical protein